jgi:hypothetical protein
MIHNIREAFYELLEEADWMDSPTRVVAREKVRVSYLVTGSLTDWLIRRVNKSSE